MVSSTLCLKVWEYWHVGKVTNLWVIKMLLKICGYWRYVIFPLADEKVSMNYPFGETFVMITLKFESLDFFENGNFSTKSD